MKVYNCVYIAIESQLLTSGLKSLYLRVIGDRNQFSDPGAGVENKFTSNHMQDPALSALSPQRFPKISRNDPGAHLASKLTWEPCAGPCAGAKLEQPTASEVPQAGIG